VTDNPVCTRRYRGHGSPTIAPLTDPATPPGRSTSIIPSLAASLRDDPRPRNRRAPPSKARGGPPDRRGPPRPAFLHALDGRVRFVECRPPPKIVGTATKAVPTYSTGTTSDGRRTGSFAQFYKATMVGLVRAGVRGSQFSPGQPTTPAVTLGRVHVARLRDGFVLDHRYLHGGVPGRCLRDARRDPGPTPGVATARRRDAGAAVDVPWSTSRRPGDFFSSRRDLPRRAPGADFSPVHERFIWLVALANMGRLRLRCRRLPYSISCLLYASGPRAGPRLARIQPHLRAGSGVVGRNGCTGTATM